MKKKQWPAHIYRENVRWGLRHLMSPEHEALLMPHERISTLSIDDLEALYRIVFLSSPRNLAPPNYRPLHAHFYSP